MPNPEEIELFVRPPVPTIIGHMVNEDENEPPTAEELERDRLDKRAATQTRRMSHEAK